MSRLLAALAVALAFGGALVYGGRALGAWDEYKPVPDKAGTRVAAHDGGTGKHAKSRGKRPKSKPTKAATGPQAAAQSWAGRANAVCRRSRPDLEVLSRELSAAETPGEFEAALTRLARANERVNAKIEAIPPPRSQRSRVRALHRLLAEDERILAGMLTAFRQRDAQRLKALGEAAGPVVQKENELFWVLGANECTLAAAIANSGALA